MTNSEEAPANGNGNSGSEDATSRGSGEQDEYPAAREPQEVRFADYVYHERDRLGEGTFGCVYKGEQLSTKRGVAVKKINKGVYVNDIELKTLTDLSSPHIVECLGVYHEPNAHYLVMNLANIDLAAFIDKYGKLTLDNLETVALSLSSAYLCLSDRNIVHRDIKSCNLLLTYSDPEEPEMSKDKNANEQPVIKKCQLTDLGCARTGAPRRKESIKLAGTAAYMAPEVGANLVNTSDYDETIDIWSIGVVLFECATGEMPFDEQKLCRIFLHAINQYYSSTIVPDTPPDLPDHLDSAITNCLKIDPKARVRPEALHHAIKHRVPVSQAVEVNLGGSISMCRLAPDHKDRLRTSSSSAQLKGLAEAPNKQPPPAEESTVTGMANKLRSLFSMKRI